VGDGVTWTKRLEADGTHKAIGTQVTAYSGGQALGTFTIVNGEIDQSVDLLQEGVLKEYRFRR
jgi:hypothetical protein